MAITEHWNHFAKIRQDLFGFIDILAIIPDESGTHTRFLAIQTTTGDHSAERVAKIKGSIHLVPILKTGCRVEVWSWRKSKKTKKWELRETPVSP